MTQPVDSTDFWKGRIERAEHDEVDHYSVYLARRDLWRDICKSHEQFIRRETAGYRTLDAGCAYGRASEWVENYTGIDFSPDFIKDAKLRYPTREFLQGNLKELPFKDGEFDIAFCISIRAMVINNLGEYEWVQMQKELLRVANKVLILEYEEWDRYWIV